MHRPHYPWTKTTLSLDMTVLGDQVCRAYANKGSLGVSFVQPSTNVLEIDAAPQFVIHSLRIPERGWQQIVPGVLRSTWHPWLI